MNKNLLKPLTGKTILVTKDIKSSESFQKELEDLGAKVISFPVITIKPLIPNEYFLQILNILDLFQWIIFTSKNAIEIFLNELLLYPETFNTLKKIQFIVVGKQTQTKLMEYGFQTSIVPREFVAESLIEEIRKIDIKDQKILFPRAKVAREIIYEELIRLGADIRVLPVYENLPQIPNNFKEVKILIEQKIVDYVTFTSSSTVKNFFSLFNNKTLKITPISIGPVTTKTLEKYYSGEILQAETFDTKGMINILSKT